jgi:TonB family protein
LERRFPPPPRPFNRSRCRPPQVYASPALGGETKVVGRLSPSLPQPGVLTMPAAYPPRAGRDGTVLVEIELTAAAMPTAHKVLSPASVFDSAALEAVKAWRFGFPG